ncbi:MAG: excinuclease ABC subunit UvrC, partial [Gammaproteobacteria bacterium]
SKQAIDSCYFGPFTSAKFARRQIKDLQKIFKLRNCADSTFSNRSRPCIEYQMKHCSAPCVSFISQSDYKQEIDRAKEYLTSEKKQLKRILNQQMKQHAKKLEFEEAHELKKRILALNALEEENNISSIPITLDILHISLRDFKTGIAVLSVREGKLQSTKTYFIDEDKRDDIEQLIQSIIFHYYQSVNQLPKTILILNKIKTSKLISRALSQKFSKKVRVILNIPRHANSFAALARLNSKQVIANYSTKPPIYQTHFEELLKTFKLTATDISIECLDISHHSGSYAKAGIAHLNVHGPQKNKYRTYKIPKTIAGNDVGSIKFAVEKRLQQKNKAPLVLLIDGGELQLQAALSAHNHSRTLILAIKKGSNRKSLTETIYSNEGQENININSKLFCLLTKARDEAHRFAIRANRSAKSKSIRGSKLDTINGIGPKRKMNLLKKFKSIDAIINASSKELKEISGITPKIIKAIKALKS